VRNGKEGTARESIFGTVLSSDGRHALSWIIADKRRQLVHNDQPIGSTNDGTIPNSRVALQPDGRFCALGHRGGVVIGLRAWRRSGARRTVSMQEFVGNGPSMWGPG
jgi:hypothetical protein